MTTADRSWRPIAGWLLAGVVGALLLAWGFPRAYPFFPQDWTISRSQATGIALERLRDLGELPDHPYVVTRLDDDPLVDRRLFLAFAERPRQEVLASWPARQAVIWEVTVYRPAARPDDWTYRVRVASDGRLVEMRLRLPRDQQGEAVDPAAARLRADELLRAQGFDLTAFEEPEVRSEQLAARTDRTLRYPMRERSAGPRVRYGIDVVFAGDRLAGFGSWIDDPDKSAFEQLLQVPTLFANLNFFSIFLVMPVIGFFFMRRYHAGEVGVQRAVQIFVLSLIASAAMLAICLGPATQGFQFGALSRSQVAWIWGAQMIFVFFLPQGLISGVSWAVGESFCRERWGAKLAAFDALWQRQWGNATVADASLRGLAAGLVLAGLTTVGQLPLQRLGVSGPSGFQLGPWWDDASLPGVALVLFSVAFTLYFELFGRLFLLSAFARRLGKIGAGLLVTVLTAVLFFPPITVLPFGWSLPFWLAWAGALTFLFLRFDLLTTMVASYTARVALGAMPFLSAANPSLELQGALAFASCAVPLLLSLRHLGSGVEFVYRWDDVPPHVRRIADRERQRVELETARNIQSSILPELPPQLNGVEIAHAYRPATEVGGDFYDVLALEDGRLALAVGDVAGHGVSSGLVMSMAKSALAVQVTFDPEVAAVFATLNRMVFQSARKRLLATLCYAVLDPRRRELQFASAGHLFPYRVSSVGKVDALESIAYPLGVRPTIEVTPRMARLEAGDLVVLFSDGVVEARPEASEDLYGFERLEQSLARHAGKSAGAVRNGLLADLARHVGDAPREDDLTLLVLRVP
ncbi:MAG: SpoIIE family protein phosphatase [Holophagales bacterium]|nr:MAG: SpoIIE family protein phosphatase [Holophagales bacterium]